MLIIGILLINFILPSDLNGWTLHLNFDPRALLNDEYLAEQVRWGLADSEFGRRPLILNVLRYAVKWTGWSYILVFLIVQVFGLGVCCCLIWHLRKYAGGQAGPLAYLLPFLCVFPQVFLFVAHAHTFDDLYQYAALLLALTALLTGRNTLLLLSLVAASTIRETSLPFLPAFAYLLHTIGRRPWWYALLLPGLAGFGALGFLYWYIPDDILEATLAFTSSRRFTGWRGNFGSWVRVSETISLVVFILSPFGYLIWRYWRELTQRVINRYLIYAFIPLAVVNTLIVFVAATAAEARLFYPPLLLLFPALASTWQRIGEHLLGGVKQWRTLPLARLVAVILVVQLLYHPSVGGTGYAFRAYVVVWSVFMFLLVWTSNRKQYTQS